MHIVKKIGLLFSITLLVSGCVYFRPVSKLSIDDSLGWKSESWDYSGVRQSWIYQTDISLMIRPHNYGEYSAIAVLPVPFVPVIKGADVKKKGYFSVTLVFDSSVNGWKGVPDSLKFNPYKVELYRQDGSILTPVGYIRPTFNYHRCYDFDYEDQTLAASIEHTSQNEWLEFPEKDSGRCFYLIYDTQPPPPSETFSFKINELKLEGKTLQVPELVFRKGID